MNRSGRGHLLKNTCACFICIINTNRQYNKVAIADSLCKTGGKMEDLKDLKEKEETSLILSFSVYLVKHVDA